MRLRRRAKQDKGVGRVLCGVFVFVMLSETFVWVKRPGMHHRYDRDAPHRYDSREAISPNLVHEIGDSATKLNENAQVNAARIVQKIRRARDGVVWS